jgi:hypothetical protein
LKEKIFNSWNLLYFNYNLNPQGGHSMSEQQEAQQNPANGGDNVEGLKNKNTELLGKLKAEKEASASLNSKLSEMSETLSALGQLVGVQEGESIADKAKALLQEKEQKAFEAMSETEKLNHRLKSIEESLQETQRAKELAEKESLSLRIDDKIKATLNAQGVTESDKQSMALDVLKARTQIDGLDGDAFLVGGEQKSIDEVVSGFLEGNKFLISNPSRGGSGFKGGSSQDTDQATINQALKKGNTTQAMALMMKQQGL